MYFFPVGVSHSFLQQPHQKFFSTFEETMRKEAYLLTITYILIVPLVNNSWPWCLHYEYIL